MFSPKGALKLRFKVVYCLKCYCFCETLLIPSARATVLGNRTERLALSLHPHHDTTGINFHRHSLSIRVSEMKHFTRLFSLNEATSSISRQIWILNELDWMEAHSVLLPPCSRPPRPPVFQYVSHSVAHACVYPWGSKMGNVCIGFSTVFAPYTLSNQYLVSVSI